MMQPTPPFSTIKHDEILKINAYSNGGGQMLQRSVMGLWRNLGDQRNDAVITKEAQPRVEGPRQSQKQQNLPSRAYY